MINQKKLYKNFFNNFFLGTKLNWKHQWKAVILLLIVFIYCSAANNGRSTVNYRQSLAFERPYLSCNDHCDRWFFQIFFIVICRSSCTQLFFKTGAIRNLAIFTGKHLCWSLFLIKLKALWPATLFQLYLKRDFTGDSCENC